MHLLLVAYKQHEVQLEGKYDNLEIPKKAGRRKCKDQFFLQLTKLYHCFDKD